jgi:hypothetical protein
MAKRVFLSYAAVDSDYASRLHHLLSQQANVRVFTTDTLSAGENWIPKLRRALAECDVFIVLLSPNSVGSKWVLYELGAAWGLKKPIIPVVIHADAYANVPLVLRDIPLVDIKDLENPESTSQILKRYEQNAA